MPAILERRLLAVLALIEQGFNASDIDVLDEVLDPDMVAHGPVPIAPGRQGFKDALRGIRAAFPDAHVRIVHLVAEGPFVFRMWTLEGTHQGEFQNLPATGRPIHLTGVDVERFEGERIVEHWSFWDRAGLLEQLGLGG